MKEGKLKIVSDGTAENTFLTVDGKELVGVQSLYFKIESGNISEAIIKVYGPEFEWESDVNQIKFRELILDNKPVKEVLK
jgi:hypothetical protein